MTMKKVLFFQSYWILCLFCFCCQLLLLLIYLSLLFLLDDCLSYKIIQFFILVDCRPFPAAGNIFIIVIALFLSLPWISSIFCTIEWLLYWIYIFCYISIDCCSSLPKANMVATECRSWVLTAMIFLNF